MLMMVFAVGCTKPDEPNNGGNSGGGNNGNNDSDVRVTTYTPQDITVTTAKCGGDAIVMQGLSLTEIGVCWSKERNPIVDQTFLSTTVWNEPFVCTITNLEPNIKYYVRAYALRGLEYYYGDEKSFITNDLCGEEVSGSYNGHDYVDLGLASETMWATCNVGAQTPEGYGDYFAWGEIRPKEVYDWSTYIYFCQDVGYSHGLDQFTKYCNDSTYGYNGYVDNLTVLETIDDAASANWGSGWCMPTVEQWRELYQNTTKIWTNKNGVNGYLFIASNGNSLFLPASGCYRQNELYEQGSRGHYWLSSLYTQYPFHAWDIFFVSDHFSENNLGNRNEGQTVRPVRFVR